MQLRKAVELEEFESAALPHTNDLYRAALNLLRNPAEAEDLVQDVYLNAWKSFHRFEKGTNCRAWLFGILFNRLHHHRRKWFQLPLAKEDPQQLAETLPSTPSVPQELRDEDMLAALDKLPREFRAVILLADVEDFAYKEIAAVLEIPMGTVMSRLSRGRKLLREALANFAPGSGKGITERGQTA
jgi:RNA polymerase sigma-70 factor (ECF subfamily)